MRRTLAHPLRRHLVTSCAHVGEQEEKARGCPFFDVVVGEPPHDARLVKSAQAVAAALAQGRHSLPDEVERLGLRLGPLPPRPRDLERALLLALPAWEESWGPRDGRSMRPATRQPRPGALTLTTTLLLVGARVVHAGHSTTGAAFPARCAPLGYGAADDLPGDEPGRRPPKATSELEGLARPQARAHKEAEEDGGTAAAHVTPRAPHRPADLKVEGEAGGGHLN